MNSHEITEAVVLARLVKGLSWEQLAEALDAPLVWATSALLGQHPLTAQQAEKVVELLELDPKAVAVLQAVPTRGPGQAVVPTDPTIYRFHEALFVYGPALKELVHEQFGDGIMSAINFSVDFEKLPHPSGDRVVVTFDGKFLPYDWAAGERK